MNGASDGGGVDVVSLRIIVLGLVLGVLGSVAGLIGLSATGHEIPPALSGLAGTLAGSLVALLARTSPARSPG